MKHVKTINGLEVEVRKCLKMFEKCHVFVRFWKSKAKSVRQLMPVATLGSWTSQKCKNASCCNDLDVKSVKKIRGSEQTLEVELRNSVRLPCVLPIWKSEVLTTRMLGQLFDVRSSFCEQAPGSLQLLQSWLNLRFFREMRVPTCQFPVDNHQRVLLLIQRFTNIGQHVMKKKQNQNMSFRDLSRNNFTFAIFRDPAFHFRKSAAGHLPD